jgi:hypothetical protein
MVGRHQTDLFSREHVAADDLLAGQGLNEPQGLAIRGEEEGMGDEADERYPAPLLDDG